MVNSVTWKIGGEAGFGIMASGTMLAKTFSRLGYHILVTNEYPSLIRGGHNVVTIRIATEKFASLDHNLHILVALNQETIDLHKNELSRGSVIIFDPHDGKPQESDFKEKSSKLLSIPLTDLVTKHRGDPVMRNTVALGATLALLGADFAKLSQVITDQFGRKGQEVVGHNLAIAQEGYDYVKHNFAEFNSFYLDKPGKMVRQLIVNGSEAVGLGAVRAGLKFAAIYPMTPINALITFLADHAKDFGIIYKQPEDEIAGINMALGASVAGARSMVATSGGGFALMVEGLALSGMIEAPLVVDMGMRVGPATGMPTYTEQGELQFMIRAGHGEFPRIILAPGDAEEAYQLTFEAFNLADKYQIPVIMLTDKYLNESQWCVPESVFTDQVEIDRGKLITREPPGEFKRYRLDVPDGVSDRTLPGLPNGLFFANSYEHDETGQLATKGDQRKAMADKRLRKFKAIEKAGKAPAVLGLDDSEITFVSWGSTKGIILEAIKLLAQKGKKARLIHFSWLYPFPREAQKILSSDSRLILVEQNATGQLGQLVREATGIEIREKLLKYDGQPFFPEEIVKKVTQ